MKTQRQLERNAKLLSNVKMRKAIRREKKQNAMEYGLWGENLQDASIRMGYAGCRQDGILGLLFD
jgi:hypothetical protein